MQHNKRVFSPYELVPEIKKIVSDGGVFPLAVTGISMRPFLTEGVDTVFIEKADKSNLKCGDPVFIYRNNCAILHRIYKITDDGFYMKGDAHIRSDGFFSFDDIVGVVKYAIDGKTNKKRRLNTPFIRFLVRLNRIRIHIFNFFKGK